MYITSISLSYIFLAIGVLSFIFFLYFRIILMKSSNKKSNTKILGKTKNPEIWRNKNNRMSYISFFWFALSVGFFVYFKFFFTSNLLSISYLFIYIALITVTMFAVMLPKMQNKKY
ncbi:hypothetical protein ACER0A_006075 [Haloimpatiens sp. FM7315]|uniref:hypothetical protein n=1 Tax=Haloimpatiens sp. FM7315 TaxID=3298609 RepID=UPI003977CE71